MLPDLAMREVHQLGKYRLVRSLATGGMGEVFLARQQGPAGFTKTVVLKRILRHLAQFENFVEMFLNEARLAALLNHPNIVQIFELGQEGDEYFIAMEYVHGRSLRDIERAFRQGPDRCPPELAAHLCHQALMGLHYAHQLADAQGCPLNIVHRDISPDNVLVSFEGAVKLVDFGIAKAANLITSTAPGSLKGKYAYMPPEQLEGRTVDARTDVYATGVLLYELLTGARPFRAESVPALIEQVVHHPPVSPRVHVPGIPIELEEIVLRALRKDPGQRFQTAREMAEALEQAPILAGSAGRTQQLQTLLRELFGDASSLPPEAIGTAVGTLAIPAPSSTAAVTQLERSARSTPPRLRRAVAVAGATVAAGCLAAAALVWSPEPAQSRSASAVVDAGTASARLAASEPAPPAPVPDPAAPPKELSPPTAPARKKRAVRRETRSEPGKVLFLVRPYAEVLFNGRSLGLTPLDPVTVPAGRQTFTLRNKELGVERRVVVQVPAGGDLSVRENLFER